MRHHAATVHKILCLCLLALAVLVPGTARADRPANVLINIVEDQSQTLNTDFLKESEMKIGRELVKMGMEVKTSDDLGSHPRLNTKVISGALKGDVPALRKAAAVLNAAYILNGKAKTRINSEEAAGVKLNKAVTVFAYKVIHTATGKTLDMDSPSYISVNQSGEAAQKSTYDKLAADITNRIKETVPPQLSSAEQKKLNQYASSFTPKPSRPATATTPPKPSAPTPSASSGSPVVAQAAPKAAGEPEIVILNPPVARGFKPVCYEKPLKIEGMAIDPDGIAEIRINGQMVAYDSKGHFSHSVELKDGENQFLVMARNQSNKIIKKVFSVDLEKDTAPPLVVLTSPETTRGFKVMLEPEIKTSLIKGRVEDDNPISYLKINDETVALTKDGQFEHETNIPDQGKISIKAEDIYGNQTTKYLQFSRGKITDEPAVLSSGRKPILWGLSIGVSKYNSTTLDLKYADQDALLLKKFFTDQAGSSFAEVHFKTIVNKEVTRESIISNISGHLGKAAPDDIVFLSIAGHGIKHRQSGSYYFLPSDADSDNLLSRGLRMSDFEESIKILSQNVEKIIVAIDSCHSGALQVGMRGAGESEDLSEAIRAAQGLYIISASKAGELSMESDKFELYPNFTGHGVFTYTLVQAMMGKADYDKDNYVSLNEMFQFVSRQVPRLTNGQQHPYFKVDGTELPLVMVK